jgi:hypothetical protein
VGVATEEDVKQAKGNDSVQYKSTASASMTSATPHRPITCYVVWINAMLPCYIPTPHNVHCHPSIASMGPSHAMSPHGPCLTYITLNFKSCSPLCTSHLVSLQTTPVIWPPVLDLGDSTLNLTMLDSRSSIANCKLSYPTSTISITLGSWSLFRHLINSYRLLGVFFSSSM